MRKILWVISIFILFSYCIMPYAQAEEIDDLQTRQEELQNQINEATGQLEGVQDEISENLEQVQKLDEKIASSQTELDELNQKMDELQNSLDEVGAKLKVAEKKYNKQKEMLEVRLIAIYETGDTQYLDVILSSRSISDFLSNYYLITELTSYDTELLEEMEKQKNKIETAKEKLDATQKEYAVIKQNQIRTAKILENTKSMRENYIAKLSDQEKDIQGKIDEYNRQFAEVNAEILSLALQGIDTKYIGGELAWPIPGYTRITSKYGMRTHPITGVYKLHTGVDVSAPMGANFVAANDGIVTKSGMTSGYGNMVMIDHGGGISTLYAHGSEIMVQVGQTVKRGETVVLKVGSTGYSTGPHAHFEVRLNGVVTDPMPYITSGIVPTTQNQNTDQEENNTENNAENNTENNNNAN